jgi:hypothetical protein
MSHEFDLGLIMEHSADTQQTPIEKLQSGIAECLEGVKHPSWKFRAFMDQVKVQELKIDEYEPREPGEKNPHKELKKQQTQIKRMRGRDLGGYKSVSERVETMIEDCRTELQEGLEVYRRETKPSIYLEHAWDDYLVQAALTKKSPLRQKYQSGHRWLTSLRRHSLDLPLCRWWSG